MLQLTSIPASSLQEASPSQAPASPASAASNPPLADLEAAHPPSPSVRSNPNHEIRHLGWIQTGIVVGAPVLAFVATYFPYLYWAAPTCVESMAKCETENDSNFGW